MQRQELNQSAIYRRLAEHAENAQNRETLREMARVEEGHARFWQQYSGQTVRPNRLLVAAYAVAARLLGFTFAAKLMEKRDRLSEIDYSYITKDTPRAEDIVQEGKENERRILGMLDEERLSYVGALVLGVNDAIVELTGALAGYTLAFQNASLVANTGLITGVAAALSMGASEYSSIQAQPERKEPLRAAVYTGSAYLLVVLLLVAPFYLLPSLYISLAFTLGISIFIIFILNFYISVAQDLAFGQRFLRMAGISLGVTAITFGIAYFVKDILGIQI